MFLLNFGLLISFLMIIVVQKLLSKYATFETNNYDG